MSSRREEKQYEALAAIDEEMTRIKQTANSLKNAEDKDKNLKALAQISDYISNIRRGYSDYEALEMEDDTEEDDYSGSDYDSGSAFLGSTSL